MNLYSVLIKNNNFVFMIEIKTVSLLPNYLNSISTPTSTLLSSYFVNLLYNLRNLMPSKHALRRGWVVNAAG
jgi:hypothetical protein